MTTKAPASDGGGATTKGKNMSDYIKQMLACNFTEDEKVALAQEMADATVKKNALEATLKEITAQYKADITVQENIIKTAAAKIHDGYEYREVDCEVEYNEPERGMKTIIRQDTGEKFSRPMTIQEKADMFCNMEKANQEDESEQ